MRAWWLVMTVAACSAPSGGGPSPGGADAGADAGAGGGADSGGGAGPDARPGAPDGAPADPLRIIADGTGITHLYWNDLDLFAYTGGYYIIGSCSGADDMNNVVSLGSDGTTLRAPGSCPGAPFHMSITGLHPIRVSIEVGPLPADYRTLSVPLDPTKELFSSFAFEGSGYEVGCGLSFSPRSGSSGAFADIPTPCHIPGAGDVGLARVRPAPPWGQIGGPIVTIRRRILSGDAQELDFFHHPGTNNIEIGFNSDFASVLPAGTVVRLEEEIEIFAGPGRASLLLPLLFRGILWREPDAAELAAHGPLVEAEGRAGMKEVADALLASGEFAGVRDSHGAEELLNQFYLGLLSREVDPSGSATFLPLVQAGHYDDVLDAIIDSEEFLSRHPESL